MSEHRQLSLKEQLEKMRAAQRVQPLLDEIPVAAKDHPETSKEAEERVNESGARARQALAILERLKQGSILTPELASMALKYSSRISDLRHMGYIIDAEHFSGGVWRYTLIGRECTPPIVGDTPLQRERRKRERLQEVLEAVVRLAAAHRWRANTEERDALAEARGLIEELKEVPVGA